ncbi:hypothetical protein EMIHUDRAFT_72091, partial [Emiliania huxleyi CCMP1516]
YYCRLLLIKGCYCGLLHAINYTLMTVDYYEAPSTAQLLTNYCDYCCDILQRTTAHYYCRLLIIRCYSAAPICATTTAHYYYCRLLIIRCYWRPVQRSCCTNYCDYCCDILQRTTAHYYCRLLIIRCYCGLLHAINYILMTIDYYESPSTALQLLHQLVRLLLQTAHCYCRLLRISR